MKLTKTDKDAIYTGIAAAIMGIAGTAFVAWCVVSGHLEPRPTPEQLEQNAIIKYEAGYQAGYMAGSRNCVKSYTQTWGE